MDVGVEVTMPFRCKKRYKDLRADNLLLMDFDECPSSFIEASQPLIIGACTSLICATSYWVAINTKKKSRSDR
jgi:predicted nucleic acid binding AN1-type Zn finger protein